MLAVQGLHHGSGIKAGIAIPGFDFVMFGQIVIAV